MQGSMGMRNSDGHYSGSRVERSLDMMIGGRWFIVLDGFLFLSILDCICAVVVDAVMTFWVDIDLLNQNISNSTISASLPPPFKTS